MSRIRTSATHPLRVDFLPSDVLPVGGKLGMTFAPGKQAHGIDCEWRRDLDADLERIAGLYRAQVLVSLVELHELQTLRIPRLFERARARGLTVDHLSITDGGVPSDPALFLALVERVVAHLSEGKNVVVHCRGGLGRTGTLVAACLRAMGRPADEAIEVVRRARPGAIENRRQEDFVRSLELPRGGQEARTTTESAERFGWEEVAYTINGYELLGSFERCAEVAHRVRSAIAAGAPPGDFATDDLRVALFFEARAQHHSGHESDGAFEQRMVSAVVARKGAGWMNAEIAREATASPSLGRDVMPLLGAALGDALGSGVEGGQALGRAIAEDRDGIGRRFWSYSPFGFKPGEVTDDTQMTLAAVQALRAGRPDLTTAPGRTAYAERVGAAYRGWLRSGPPDVGAATRAALLDPSILGGFRSWAGGDSAGNGSLMRATTPFTAGYRGAELLAAAVVDSAITHPDPRCVAACLWYSATLEAAADVSDPAKIADVMRRGLEVLRDARVDIEALLGALAEGAPKEWAAFRSRWSEARAEVARSVEAALAGEHIDCLTSPWTQWPTGFVMDSLRQAAWAALQGHTADEPLRLAVLHGGRDADTIGAITGGLVGARFGEQAMEHWSLDLLAQVRLEHAPPGVPSGTILGVVRDLLR